MIEVVPVISSVKESAGGGGERQGPPNAFALEPPGGMHLTPVPPHFRCLKRLKEGRMKRLACLFLVSSILLYVQSGEPPSLRNLADVCYLSEVNF